MCFAMRYNYSKRLEPMTESPESCMYRGLGWFPALQSRQQRSFQTYQVQEMIRMNFSKRITGARLDDIWKDCFCNAWDLGYCTHTECIRETGKKLQAERLSETDMWDLELTA